MSSVTELLRLDVGEATRRLEHPVVIGAAAGAALKVDIGIENLLAGARVGQSEDIAGAVLFSLTNTFLTGVTLKVDGAQELVQPAATAR